MRNIVKILIAVLAVLFIAIQFFPVEINDKEETENHIFKNEQIPPDVQQIIQNACIDCHSDKTNYPFYDKIAPVSWMVKKHINEGKKELNFSEWGTLDAYDKFGAFEDIQKEVERKTMPLKSYTFMHKQARLSDEQVKQFVDWCKFRSEELTKDLSK